MAGAAVGKPEGIDSSAKLEGKYHPATAEIVRRLISREREDKTLHHRPFKTRMDRIGDHGTLVGWKQIADFLGQPLSFVKRWAADGMPVQQDGPEVTASVQHLTQWLTDQFNSPISHAESRKPLKGARF